MFRVAQNSQGFNERDHDLFLTLFVLERSNDKINIHDEG
jgi:hypothetical protein